MSLTFYWNDNTEDVGTVLGWVKKGDKDDKGKGEKNDLFRVGFGSRYRDFDAKTIKSVIKLQSSPTKKRAASPSKSTSTKKKKTPASMVKQNNKKSRATPKKKTNKISSHVCVGETVQADHELVTVIGHCKTNGIDNCTPIVNWGESFISFHLQVRFQ